MAIPFFVVIYVGIKSVSKIKQLPSSNYGKGLQMQLHNALVAQVEFPEMSLIYINKSNFRQLSRLSSYLFHLESFSSARFLRLTASFLRQFSHLFMQSTRFLILCQYFSLFKTTVMRCPSGSRVSDVERSQEFILHRKKSPEMLIHVNNCLFICFQLPNLNYCIEHLDVIRLRCNHSDRNNNIKIFGYL